MKLNNIKRIITEDFPKDDRVLVEKLSFALNPFLEQISTIFNKNVDFDNLNQEVLTFTIQLDSNGIPKTQTQIKTSLKTKIRGILVIKLTNLENDSTFPTGAPFITYSVAADLITIQHVTGIPANKRYTISAIAIG